MAAFTVDRPGGVVLSGEDTGGDAAEPGVVLLHGLTASRRYVVMGSKLLERSGLRVVAYDARGHGWSTGSDDPSAYTYADLAGDLTAVLDARGLDRAVLAGASMGAHTALRLALAAPDRVAGLVVVTPAYDEQDFGDVASLAQWDALAAGLRSDGIDGFVAAYPLADKPERWQSTLETVLRQRLATHVNLAAVADAVSATPRSRPFRAVGDLQILDAPTVVVADRDEADPGHPLAVGAAYAAAIPGATLVVEDEGASPLAWQGGQLSRVIADLVARTAG